MPTGPVFSAPWEAQAFAMVLALHERGLFTWPEWARRWPHPSPRLRPRATRTPASLLPPLACRARDDGGPQGRELARRTRALPACLGPRGRPHPTRAARSSCAAKTFRPERVVVLLLPPFWGRLGWGQHPTSAMNGSRPPCPHPDPPPEGEGETPEAWTRTCLVILLLPPLGKAGMGAAPNERNEWVEAAVPPPRPSPEGEGEIPRDLAR
jgi:hypothetical protein